MKKLTILTLSFLLLFLLAACGGGEAGPPASTTVKVNAMDNLTFAPGEVTVVAGSKVIVDFINEGALEHNWVLVSADAEMISVTEDSGIAGATMGPVAGGSSNKINFTAPAAGEYKYVCTIPGHAAGGMVGTFMVTDN